jgi:hypothetical protein
MSQKSILKSPDASKKNFRVRFSDEGIRGLTLSSLPFFHYSKAQVSEVLSVIQTAKSQILQHLKEKKSRSHPVLSLRVKSLEMTSPKGKRTLSCTYTSRFSEYLNEKKAKKPANEDHPQYIKLKEIMILKEKKVNSISTKQVLSNNLIQKFKELKSN